MAMDFLNLTKAFHQVRQFVQLNFHERFSWTMCAEDKGTSL